MTDHTDLDIGRQHEPVTAIADMGRPDASNTNAGTTMSDALAELMQLYDAGLKSVEEAALARSLGEGSGLFSGVLKLKNARALLHAIQRDCGRPTRIAHAVAATMRCDAPQSPPPRSVVDSARKDIALESTYQAEMLLNLLLEKVASPEWELDHEPCCLLTTIGVRLKQLNSTIMSVLSDDDHVKLEEMRYTVTGRHPSTATEDPD